MSEILDTKKGKYQVWITDYPLNGADESSKYDPGFQLMGQFETIEEAVKCLDEHKNHGPLITKFVTWQTKITDITDGAKFPSLAFPAKGVL